MDFSAVSKKLRDMANRFRTGWTWIMVGDRHVGWVSSPATVHWFENLTESSGGNPIGLDLLAMAAFGLSQLCLLVAIFWMGYGIFRMLCSPIS